MFTCIQVTTDKEFYNKNRIIDNPFIFRKILEELGYRTNQHSAISDNIEQECLREITERVRDTRSVLKLQKVEFQKLRNELDRCYSALNDSLFQYKKSHNDLQSLNQTLDVNDAAGIEKMKRTTEMKKREFERCKQNYALDLETTNTKEKVKQPSMERNVSFSFSGIFYGELAENPRDLGRSLQRQSRLLGGHHEEIF